MKRLCCCLAIFLVADIVLSADEKTEKAVTALSGANQLESSLLGDGAKPSKLAPMFVALVQSENREQQFERLITSATTNAGEAYGILGLYVSRPDSAVERAKSLPTDFEVPYMLFCITGKWGREEFVQQLENGNLLRAVSYPVRK